MPKTFKPETAKTFRECGFYVESTRAHRYITTATGKLRVDVYADCTWRVSENGGLIDGNRDTHPAYAAMMANECAWQWRDRINAEHTKAG